MNLEFWKSYANCWSASDVERGVLLAELAAGDVTYRDPQTEVRGHHAFSGYMGAFQNGFPGHRFEIARVDAHHGRSLAHWSLVDRDGKHVQGGVSCAVHDAQGRLADITGFFPVAS